MKRRSNKSSKKTRKKNVKRLKRKSKSFTFHSSDVVEGNSATAFIYFDSRPFEMQLKPEYLNECQSILNRVIIQNKSHLINFVCPFICVFCCILLYTIFFFHSAFISICGDHHLFRLSLPLLLRKVFESVSSISFYIPAMLTDVSHFMRISLDE